MMAIILLAVLGTRADQWPSARTKEAFSENRAWFVRVVPGKSYGDTVGFAGSPKGPYARAEFYLLHADRSYRLVMEVTLQNPVAPARFEVTDRGYLITLDNWHNMGYGKTVVFYSPQGRVLAAYGLGDFFSKEEIERFSHSVSSIWWRKETVYVRGDQQSLYVSIDDKGSALIFETETGAWQYCEHRGPEYLCRNRISARTWTGYREPPLRP